MPQSSIPVVTEYITMRLPEKLIDSFTPEDIISFHREITLQAQGEAVELIEENLPLILALAFALTYDISDETILRLNDGRKVLIFDHNNKETLRPEDIDETLWAEILKIKTKITDIHDVLGPTPTAIIDLSAIWDKTQKNIDSITRTKYFIKAFVKELSPVLTLRLRGEIETLPLLLAIYLCRPSVKNLIFEDAHNRSVTLFSNT